MITKRSIRLATAAAVALAAAITVTGCGEVAEKAAEEAINQGTDGDVQLDLDDKSIKVEGQDGSVAIGGGELPEDFPADITLPEGGTVVAGSSFSDGASKGWLVESTYPDSPSDLADTFETELTGSGFEQTGTFTTDGVTTATYEGNGYEVATAVTTADGGSSLTVTVSQM